MLLLGVVFLAVCVLYTGAALVGRHFDRRYQRVSSFLKASMSRNSGREIGDDETSLWRAGMTSYCSCRTCEDAVKSEFE